MAECCRVGSNSVVLHILVVDFHHQKGATVSFLHPSLSSSPTDSLTAQLPQSWRHIPYIALPDGCHNYAQGTVYFTLPSLEVSTGAIYGVACFRQLEAKELQSKDVDVTRSTVQKSVCILSRVPLFGFIEAKLDIVTHAYFNGKFTDTAILLSAYSDMNCAINPQMALSVCHVGYCPADQVEHYQHRLLQIFKALLLRRKVLVYGSSSGGVSKSVMSIVSLLPQCVECLVDLSTSDSYGFPLQIFPLQSSLQPYLSLQQMDLLTAKDSRLLLTGVVNPLFEKQKDKLCDVFVNMETSMVDILSHDLQPLLSLTSADLRFCSLLSSGIQGDSSPVSPHSTAGWYGSHDWVRMQFKMYVLSLLATCRYGDTVSMEHFNSAFVVALVRSSSYKVWAASTHEGMEKVTPTHPCEGHLSMGDLKRKLYVQMSDYGLSLQSRDQVVRVLQSTQQVLANTTGKVSSAVSGIWSAASSWWTGGNSSQDSS